MSTGFDAEKLAEARRANSWGQQELADKIGVSKWSVCQWERGHDKPRPTNLAAAAAALGLEPEDLCGDGAPGSLGEARYRVGLTQAALGQRVGTSESTIAAVEAGNMSIPERIIDAWAQAIGISGRALLRLLP